MKTKLIIGSIAILGVLGTFTLNATAATYQYVDTSGSLRSVEAVSPSQALAIAPNLAMHSGVMLYGPATSVVLNNQNYTFSTLPYVTYQYVNTSGQIQTVTASNSDQAFSLATNIDPKSGVIRVNAYSSIQSSGVATNY